MNVVIDHENNLHNYFDLNYCLVLIDTSNKTSKILSCLYKKSVNNHHSKNNKCSKPLTTLHHKFKIIYFGSYTNAKFVAEEMQFTKSKWILIILNNNLQKNLITAYLIEHYYNLLTKNISLPYKPLLPNNHKSKVNSIPYVPILTKH